LLSFTLFHLNSITSIESALNAFLSRTLQEQRLVTLIERIASRT